MTRTCALYVVPEEGKQAERHGDFESSSPAKARAERKRVCESGLEVAIHVGSAHPEPLPFGERLWRELPEKAST